MILTLMAWASEVCTTWDPTGTQTVFEGSTITESSGVTQGRLDPDLFYTLDDADGEAILHIFTLQGELLGDQQIRGAENIDWEDLAAGQCPTGINSESCLFIADIGDNDELRDTLTIYTVPESTRASEDATTCQIKYPEGKHYDAETLLVFPDGALRIVTKNQDGESKVFYLEELNCQGQVQEMIEETELSLTGAEEVDRKVTGGAVSPDGSYVVLRSYSQGWRFEGCPLTWTNPTLLDLGSQPQGEALVVLEDGGLVTTSEGTPFRVWELPCTASIADPCLEKCGCKGESAWIWLLGIGWIRRRAI